MTISDKKIIRFGLACFLFVMLFSINLFLEKNKKQDQNSIIIVRDDFSEVKGSLLFGNVTKVVDGDTLKVNIEGREEVIRLIGINTPESVDPRTKVECFGKEASQNMKSFVSGKKVYLESDSTQSKEDKYGRLLMYVYTEEGNFINASMIASGYAFEYTYNLPYTYQEKFKSLEYSARINKLGLWDDSVCDYKENPKGRVSK